MVENWEIVLANGSVVNANAKENADLWKAQKGGSGNLGFVTSIDQSKTRCKHNMKLTSNKTGRIYPWYPIMGRIHPV